MGGRYIMFSGRPRVRPSVNIYFTWRDISLLSEGISMKSATNIHHVSTKKYWKCFQRQRSDVKGSTKCKVNIAIEVINWPFFVSGSYVTHRDEVKNAAV